MVKLLVYITGYAHYMDLENISKNQKLYAANDDLYLHKIKEELKNFLLQENRLDIDEKVFKFLPIRVELDLNGFNDLDIFAH